MLFHLYPRTRLRLFVAGRESEIPMGPPFDVHCSARSSAPPDQRVEVRDLVRLIVAMKMQGSRPGVARRPPVKVVNNPIIGHATPPQSFN